MAVIGPPGLNHLLQLVALPTVADWLSSSTADPRQVPTRFGLLCVAIIRATSYGLQHTSSARYPEYVKIVCALILRYTAGEPKNLPDLYFGPNGVNLGGILAWEFLLMHWVEVGP